MYAKISAISTYLPAHIEDNAELVDARFIKKIGVKHRHTVKDEAAGDLALKAGALVGYNAYTEKPSKNNYWDALGNVELANENIKVGDRLLYTSDPANSELTERYKRMNNTAYAAFKTTNKKLFSVGLSVEDLFDRYFDGEMDGLNRNRFNAGAQLFYNFNTKTNLFEICEQCGRPCS